MDNFLSALIQYCRGRGAEVQDWRIQHSVDQPLPVLSMTIAMTSLKAMDSRREIIDYFNNAGCQVISQDMSRRYDRSIIMQVIMYCDADAISYAYRKTIIVDNIKIIDDTWIDEEVVI
jgi:hypothetical protein